MPDIYTTEWYEAMYNVANNQGDLSGKLPQEEFKLAVEVHGDGKSPYVPEGTTKHFFVRIHEGKVAEYRESEERITGKDLRFRVVFPASIFEEVSAGLLDPVELGLNGTINIRGDMRFIMQNADMLNVIFDVYTKSNVTEWPKGMPPYATCAA